MFAKTWTLLALLVLSSLSLAASPSTQINAWQVKGMDSIAWTAQLVFLEESNVGYFDWKSADGANSGREPFTYSFDDKTQVLRIWGAKIIDPKGNIIHAQYKATLSEDGKRLENGTWFGPGVLPGTWTATRAKTTDLGAVSRSSGGSYGSLVARGFSRSPRRDPALVLDLAPVSRRVGPRPLI